LAACSRVPVACALRLRRTWAPLLLRLLLLLLLLQGLGTGMFSTISCCFYTI